MKNNRLTLICIGCTLLILIPTSVSYSSNIELTKEITPAELEFIELVPDTDLSESPTVVVNGTSEEFDSLYHHGGAGESNHVNLTWTHTPGAMSWREGWNSSWEYPASYDYIYFTQTFEWDYEFCPIEAYGRIDFAITGEGSFVTEEAGQLMFKIYIWLIDSSGNWRRIYRSFPPYTESYQNRIPHLNYFDMKEGWEGMVEDDNGHQEDPDDTLTIAVGLAPTHYFLEWLGEEPWKTYNGSVVATIRQLNLIALVDEPPLQEQYQPEYNGTLDWMANDMALSLDDSIYLVGDIGSYEQGYNLTLAKMDEHANVLWSRSFEDRTRTTLGSGVDVSSDGFIYTVGTASNDGADLLLVKWDVDGNVVWNRTWGNPHNSVPRNDEYGRGVLVSPNGSIFTIGELRTLDWDPELDYVETHHVFIVKWDSEGQPIWNITSPDGYWTSDVVDMAMFDERILTTSSWHGLLSWSSSEVESLIDTQAVGLSISDNNQINTVGSNNYNITLSQWKSDGSMEWNTTWGYRATPPEIFSDTSYPVVEVEDYYPYLQVKDLAISDESTIFVSGGITFRGPGFLIKFDSTGNQLWNISYGEAWNGSYAGMGIDIEIGSNGFIYILNRAGIGTVLMVFEEPYATTTSSTNTTDVTTTDDFLALIGVAGIIGISLVAIVVIIQRRRI